MADAALVSSVTASWGAWSDQTVELALPSGWRPITLAMSDAPELTSSEIDQALASPVGAPTLEALARVHQRVAIAIVRCLRTELPPEEDLLASAERYL